MFHQVKSANELESLVAQVGFLPFFKNEISGFSIEECTPRELWFAKGVDGPWEWKGPVLRGKRCVYGKLFRGKTGYVSLDWLPDFANWRRQGYDFDARYNDGLVSWKDKRVFDKLDAHDSLLSTDLKLLCGDLKGFDTSLTRLQMQTYITTTDFEYCLDRHGNTYGWGIARYATVDRHLGYDVVASAYSNALEVSQKKILSHLEKLLPNASPDQLLRLVG